jgi:hypothetical protein
VSPKCERKVGHFLRAACNNFKNVVVKYGKSDDYWWVQSGLANFVLGMAAPVPMRMVPSEEQFRMYVQGQWARPNLVRQGFEVLQSRL